MMTMVALYILKKLLIIFLVILGVSCCIALIATIWYALSNNDDSNEIIDENDVCDGCPFISDAGCNMECDYYNKDYE